MGYLENFPKFLLIRLQRFDFYKGQPRKLFYELTKINEVLDLSNISLDKINLEQIKHKQAG